MKFSWSEFRLFSRFNKSKFWIKKVLSRLSRWRHILSRRKVFKFLSSNFLLFSRKNWLCFSMRRRCSFKSSFNSRRFFSTFLFNFDFVQLLKRHVALLIHKSHDLKFWVHWAHFERSLEIKHWQFVLRQRSHENIIRTFFLTICSARRWREFDLRFIATWLTIKQR